jgi:ribosomal protein S18 acetylase RimI-like enzyme
MNSARQGAACGHALTSRLYADKQDLQRMQAMLMQARAHSGDDWRYAHVGELIFAFFMVDCHLEPREHIRLWHDAGGRLAAYAILGEDPAFDCQVAPQHAGCGVEDEALAWAEGRLDGLRRADAPRWGGGLVCGARQDDPERVAFLERHGFRYSGEFAEVNMLRTLDGPLPEPALPAGCQVRALAEAGETAQRAAAQRAVWLPWTVGEVRDEDYARFMRLPGYDRELDIVAVTPQGVIAAYANGWIDPLNRIGDFGPVGALPAYRRQGLTRAVLLEGLRRFQARGMQRACVSTGVTNTPALRLYASLGFRVVNRYLDYVKAPDAPAGVVE